MNDQPNYWEEELRNRQHYLTTNPELAHSTAASNLSTFEKGIGISDITENRFLAYWPLSFSDYCIEEHLRDGRVAEINSKLEGSGRSGDYIVLQAVTAAGTPAVINWLRQSLALEVKDIGYASSKEPGLITSQFFSIPAASAERLASLQPPTEYKIIITGTTFADEAIAPSMLKGGTHTMLLRTKEAFENEVLGLKTDILAKYGVLNYFPTKRFGRRHNSHLLGKLVLAENFEEAVKDFLCQTSPAEELLITRLREVAQSGFPNFEKLDKIFSVLPVTFANELAVIRYLHEHPSDYAGAIIQIKHLARQWLFAYGAYIFNANLSEMAETNGITDEQLPWTFSPETADKLVYRRFFERDGIFNGFEVNFIKELIPERKQLLPGRIHPKNIVCRSSGKGVALSFFLDGTLPAETVMANLFNTTNSTPAPEWVDTAGFDAKQILDQGKLIDVALMLSQQNA